MDQKIFEAVDAIHFRKKFRWHRLSAVQVRLMGKERMEETFGGGRPSDSKIDRII